jgi:hypothetical protein
MYPSNIPALPAVASSQAQALNALSAPAIQAGTPLNDQDILSAQRESQARQQQRVLDGDAELAQAAMREHVVISSHAQVQAQFAGAVAPAWSAVCTGSASCNCSIAESKKYILHRIGVGIQKGNAYCIHSHMVLWMPFKIATRRKKIL